MCSFKDIATFFNNGSTLITLAMTLLPGLQLFSGFYKWSVKQVAITPPKNETYTPLSYTFVTFPLTRKPGLMEDS